MPIGVQNNAVTAEYPQQTLIATPTFCSHSRTALYETYLASQESGCVGKYML